MESKKYEFYDHSIARSILPVKGDPSLSTNKSGKYVSFQISDAWVSNSNVIEYNIANHDIGSVERIHDAEDHVFINGDKSIGITGINATNTIRYDLISAIKEFNAKYVIANKDINLDGVIVFQCKYLDDSTCYLVPNGITDKDAEFIISDDIKEVIYNYTGIKKVDENSDNRDKKQFWHELYEWISINIYNPDFFVKVVDKKYIIS